MRQVFLMLMAVLASILAILIVEERRWRREAQPRGQLAMLWDGRERRRTERYAVTCEVRYSLLSWGSPPQESSTVSGASRTTNLSQGGMCLILGERLKEGSRITLRLVEGERGGDLVRQAVGEIAWNRELPQDMQTNTRRFLTGIRFLKVDRHDRKALQTFLKHRGGSALP